MSKINCSVGVLTNNSVKVIERCLSSLNDFEEVVICDGGSTDQTIEIAKRYNCKIINQENEGLVIEDFSKQRNLMIEASSSEWFLYIDADEVMTENLSKNVEVAINSNSNYQAYKLKYNLCSPDLKTIYYQYPESKQIRLFKINSGIKFIKKMHERVNAVEKNVKIGELDGYWLVPLDEQLSFLAYKKKVDYRMKVLVTSSPRIGIIKLIKKVIIGEVIRMIKIIGRAFLSRIVFMNKRHVPLKYDIYRLYSPLITIFLQLKKFFSL